MTQGDRPATPPAQPPDAATPPVTGHDAESLFGAALESSLIQATGDHLKDLHWFRTDWQRGGALTGYATYVNGEGERPAVVKLPVPPQELIWLERLQPDRHDQGHVVPDIYISGRELGQYDLPWVVMQRMPHGPLDHTWGGVEFDHLVEAAGRFYAATRRYEVDTPLKKQDWKEVLKRSRAAVRKHELPNGQRWNAGLKDMQKRLKKWLKKWDKRDTDDWCHGDLHLANAMTDTPPPEGPAVLFDLALVRRGHWVEDAVYFESLFWATPDRLDGRDLVKMTCKQRKEHGIKACANWPLLADIRRALLAAAAPAQHASYPDLHRLQASLLMLEKMLNKLPGS